MVTTFWVQLNSSLVPIYTELFGKQTMVLTYNSGHIYLCQGDYDRVSTLLVPAIRDDNPLALESLNLLAIAYAMQVSEQVDIGVQQNPHLVCHLRAIWNVVAKLSSRFSMHATRALHDVLCTI